VKHAFASTALLIAAAALFPGQTPAAVRVGYCTPLRNLEAAKAAGFDYVELSATEIASLTDADFEKAANHIKEVGLPTPAANLFLPAALVTWFYLPEKGDDTVPESTPEPEASSPTIGTLPAANAELDS